MSALPSGGDDLTLTELAGKLNECATDFLNINNFQTVNKVSVDWNQVLIVVVSSRAAAPNSDAAATAGGLTEGDELDSNKWSKTAFGQNAPKNNGKFTKEESELVRKAVVEYCTTKQISVGRLCSEFDHKAELKGAWMEIAKQCPQRSVQSVYRKGIRMLHPYKRGAWTEQECQALMDLVATHGKKWSTIQRKLNRSADACRDKHREMSEEYVKGRWKDEEVELFLQIIRDLLNVGQSMSIKELVKFVERRNIAIQFSAVSKRLGNRSRLSCYKKWQKLTGGLLEEEEGYAQNAKRKPSEYAEESLKRVKTGPKYDGESGTGGDYDVYSAKMADSTIEAVGLPDARASFV